MTEEEWESTAPGEALTAFKRYMFNLAVVVVAGGLGGLATKPLSTMIKSGMPEKDAALIDPQYQRSLLWAQPIIASFSAFEAYVEDFIKGVMQMKREILDDDRILAMKVPMRDLLAPEEEKLDKVYRAMHESVGRVPGVVRYEDLLKLVDLSDKVPEIIKDEFYKAQMVRHVWAHNAGIADAQFVNRARHLGAKKGQVVAITQNDATEYMLAITAYGVLVANRHRTECGLDPMPIGTHETKSQVYKAFRDFYKAP
jgi:hypothetical protein